MKTYCLDGVSSIQLAKAALSSIFPGQSQNWMLRSPDGDPIAYFDVVDADVDLIGPAIIADISGRHFDEDPAVVTLLEQLRQKVGGVIVSDNEIR